MCTALAGAPQLGNCRGGLEAVEPALVGVQRSENALAQPVDPEGIFAIPVPVRGVRVERGRAAVNGEEPAAADRVVHRTHRTEAMLLDFFERALVGASARPLDEDLLQRGAAVARDFQLATGRGLSQRTPSLQEAA